jgi:hypothetical protein
VTEQKILLEQEAGYYHFWIGVLNTPIDNVRSWQPMYGYTEIAGQQITTGLIKDSLSRLVIDLINAKITAANGAEIIGKMTFSAGSSGYNNLNDKPDLSVYSTGIKTALDAAEEASNAANSASTTASNAQTTANSAAKVFYSTSAPTSGMRTNDLWVDGMDIRRYSGSSWVLASKYDVTETVINGGLITTGAITFGSTGGMTASGTTRIWAGADGVGNAEKAKFRVTSQGAVYSKNSFYIEDKGGRVDGGFSSSEAATDKEGSVRFWIGGEAVSSAKFKVESNGDMFGMRLYAGDGTRTGGSALTAMILSVGSSQRTPTSERTIYVFGNSSYPPRLLLYTGEQTNPFFEVSGRGYSSEWFKRTVIRCAWLPTKDMLESWYGKKVNGHSIKHDMNSGAFYFE